jgi:chromosome segregation ATPase
MKGQFEKEIKLRNFDEHYSQILRDIDSSNKELSKVRETLVFTNKEKELLDSKIDNLIKDINNLILQKESEKSKIRTDKEKFENYISIKTKELDAKILEVERLTLFRDSEIKRYNFEKAQALEAINNLQKDVASLSDQKELLEKDVNQIRSTISISIDSSIKEREAIQDNIDHLESIKINRLEEIKLFENKLSDVKKDYEDKVNYIKNSQDLLKEREVLIRKKEIDFEVIKRRLVKKFKQEYPDLMLKI